MRVAQHGNSTQRQYGIEYRLLFITSRERERERKAWTGQTRTRNTRNGQRYHQPGLLQVQEDQL